ncbi:MAG: penicillin acylase family protein [Ignavibacteria bacterium]|nr:penicillin acylase family protein [Ignavibacteria bacterium]
MKNWKRILLGITGSLIILLIVFFVIAYLILNKSLPQYEGEIKVTGLNSDVNIYRDSSAIPLISASNDEDLAFALGYVHAQERLFQMDLARRAGEGRLSEVFGSRTVPFDKMFRTIGLYQVVQSSFPKLNPISQKILIAYSKGVNSFLENSKGKYPIEFDILGYDPYPWKPEHSLLIAKLMAWELNISWWSDIAFSNLVQKLGVDKVKELLPDFPENAPTIIPKEITSYVNLNNNLIDVDRKFRDFFGITGTHIGSNNWVINGKISKSNKPIIANDPHLGFTAPGKWYFAILRSNDWNAEGFTIPGLPSIVIGKNQNIAWAMTNVMTDDADFYVEKIDSSGTKYSVNNQWKDLETFQDSFAVKDSSLYKFTIRKTYRGPIISDVHLFNLLYPEEGKVNSTISMRWTALDFSDEVFAAVSLNKAKNWDDFKTALKYYTVPGQNFVYADKDGNIGYVCATKLPIRSSSSPTLIYDGSTDAFDWKGFVPYEEMPKLFNPAQNFIASANNKTVNNFRYHISNVWEPSSRIERITELLKSRNLHSVKDFENYQMDFYSPYAKEIVPYILNAFKDAKITDNNLKIALELLNNWNFEMDASSQVPTIYLHFFHQLIKNIFEDELGNDLLKEYVILANVPYRIIQKYLKGNSSPFFDNIKTPQVETRDDIIRQSLVDALIELESKFGKEISSWQWGSIHKVKFKHMFSGASSILDKLIDIGPYEIGGDGTTVFNTEYSFSEIYEKDRDFSKPRRSEPYQNILGPSMRYIFDFGDSDYLQMILPTGQAGHFRNPHYKDMTDMWLKGKYKRIPLNEENFIKSSKHLLKLIP